LVNAKVYMFFIFSKILLFLTYPFTWIALTLISAVIWHKKKFARKLLLVSLSLLLFFSNTIIFCELARHWEVGGKKINELPMYDCAIVLTGMASYNNDLDRLSLERNGDRIWQAIDLYHKGKVKKILITGDSGMISDRGLKEAKQLGEVIKGWNVREQDIIIEDKSQNTHENAKFTSELLQHSHPELKSFLLVTSAIHMKRSLACFVAQKLNCTPFSTNHFTGPKRGYYFEQYILPNSEILASWQSLTKEWVGYLMYWMAGYV
jgi:uncharacterized SAM-binding protein YcdF (DUF218 family)